MNRRFIVYGIFALCLVTFMLSACEKDPGEGGSATVKGVVIVRDLDSDGNLKDEYGAQDERVFMIYGDNSIYDDDTRTHYDGSFQFKYLYKGEYTIYVYTKCDEDEEDCPTSEQKPVMTTFEITEKGQTFDLDTIYIID